MKSFLKNEKGFIIIVIAILIVIAMFAIIFFNTDKLNNSNGLYKYPIYASQEEVVQFVQEKYGKEWVFTGNVEVLDFKIKTNMQKNNSGIYEDYENSKAYKYTPNLKY